MKQQSDEIERLKAIKYIVIDVDGTLTDSGIYYDEHGNELKKFSTRDAAGFFAATVAGIKTIIITGRECAATTRRMKELKADFTIQNVKNKEAYLRDYMAEHSIAKEQLAYIGDDLNDLAPMQLAGFIACPADSCQEVMRIADYISPIKGGYGAVRDVIENMLRYCGEWDDAVRNVYGIGV